mmetsp:Transcript_1031/g.3475  ORF Transcript_1031/g.3475 Transcript_1031/m.3475 type:complete len:375 (-) Transcript_1031:153-1277(-)
MSDGDGVTRRGGRVGGLGEGGADGVAVGLADMGAVVGGWAVGLADSVGTAVAVGGTGGVGEALVGGVSGTGEMVTLSTGGRVVGVRLTLPGLPTTGDGVTRSTGGSASGLLVSGAVVSADGTVVGGTVGGAVGGVVGANVTGETVVTVHAYVNDTEYPDTVAVTWPVGGDAGKKTVKLRRKSSPLPSPTSSSITRPPSENPRGGTASKQNRSTDALVPKPVVPASQYTPKKRLERVRVQRPPRPRPISTSGVRKAARPPGGKVTTYRSHEPRAPAGVPSSHGAVFKTAFTRYTRLVAVWPHVRLMTVWAAPGAVAHAKAVATTAKRMRAQPAIALRHDGRQVRGEAAGSWTVSRTTHNTWTVDSRETRRCSPAS